MAKIDYVTSESVTEGHPDKICDQISDAILDSLYAQDPYSRVAVECLTTTGLIVVAGEVTTRGYADIQGIARRTLREIGYTNPQFGIDCEDAGVLVSVHGQSSDIAQGVNESSSHEQGAGDQRRHQRPNGARQWRRIRCAQDGPIRHLRAFRFSRADWRARRCV